MRLGEGTVDDIVTAVRCRIRTDQIEREIQRLDRVLNRKHLFAELRRRFRATRGARIGANISQAGADHPVFKLTISGVAFGEIRPGNRGKVRFRAGKVAQTFRSHWPYSDDRDWTDRCVRDYVKQAVASAGEFDSREAPVQDQLIRLMKAPERGRTHPLSDYSPVCWAGIPIQFPLPIAPRGKSGNDPGNLDVLARHGSGVLSIFEVKRPGAPDAAHALDQALWYAAQVRVLMDRPAARRRYWELFGSRRRDQEPLLEAVAFIDSRSGARARSSFERLSEANEARIGLKVITYDNQLVPRVAYVVRHEGKCGNETCERDANRCQREGKWN